MIVYGSRQFPAHQLQTRNQPLACWNLLNPDQGKYYGVIHYLDDGSTANYNALLVSLQHRLSNHFTVLGNYTWSHCIAGIFTSELDGTQYTNPQNQQCRSGAMCASIDRRSIFNVSSRGELKNSITWQPSFLLWRLETLADSAEASPVLTSL